MTGRCSTGGLLRRPPGGRFLAGTLALAAAAAPLLPAGPTRAADPPRIVEVVVEKITPVVLKPGNTVTLRGTVVNRGAAPLREGQVTLDVRRSPFTNRADMGDVADDRTPLPGSTQAAAFDLPGIELAPGASTPWKLAVKVKDLRLPGNGVYPVGVNVRGDGSDRALDTRTTFLPYLPDPKGYAPTKVSWMWPLIGQPMRDPEGVFGADASGAQFAPGTRLGDLSTAPGTRSVAWVVDPQLLDDAAALGGEHRSRAGDKTAKTPGEPGAAQWVAGLRQQFEGRPVAATPYADPDLLGLIGTGASDIVERALVRARSTTVAAFGRESDTSLVWPPSGLANVRTLAALRRLGTKTVVLSGDQFPVLGTLNYTPTGRTRLSTRSGDLEVLIADAGLTRVLDRDLRAPGAFALAQQQLLAETALITLERPNAPRAVLMAPPRRWDPPPAAAKGLLEAFAAAPWMRASRLDTFSGTRVPAEMAGAQIDERPAGAAPKLPRDYARDLLGGARDADTIRAVLVGGGPAVYETAVLRAASSTWTTNLDAARGYLRGVRQWVRGDMGKVKVKGRSLVTLSGSRGSIPITVSNGLSQPVRLRPTIIPLVPGRLRVSSPDLLTIKPGRNPTVRIPAEAGANGITRVRVELRDAAGNRYGEPTDLKVNVTNYGSVGLIVVLGGGGLLFAVAIARNIRRVQRHRHRARGHSQTPEPGAERNENAEESVQL